MELIVNDRVKIITEPYNYTVWESRTFTKDTKKNKEGDVIWEPRSYHANLRDAARSMMDSGIVFCETFNEVMSFVNLVHRKIDLLK